MKDRKTKHNNYSIELQLNDSILPNVDKAVHLEKQRSKTDKETIENTVSNKITKAIRTAYSLMSAGFHGNNGLDPSTCIHILKTYIIPTLIYGLEIIVTDETNMEKLLKFHKRMIKQIISVTQNTSDVVPYIISGLIPIVGQIHLRTLTYVYNIFLLPETSTEKQLSRRQLYLKSVQSNSWFNIVKKIFWKYNLPDIYLQLETPYKKMQLKQLIYQEVFKYWKDQMTTLVKLYKHLGYLNLESYNPGKQHPLIFIPTQSARDTYRILVSGSYIFQANRSRFNQNQKVAKCLLCGEDDEDMKLFLLNCTILESTRHATTQDIEIKLYKTCKLKLAQINTTYIGLLISTNTLKGTSNAGISLQRAFVQPA
ncbi:unnamed protein product [Mytilus coruscus]|uniref:Reverse transcriptase zinc-binding domain-containing protein n=1 Tax=Mytilus coruscus TaxID=42192 RepID=A0A6J8CKI9_MYTCO|nr:unnamed protein product [Mytilus coruscus]